MSTKGKYISVGVLRYRSDLDDVKQPTREYGPGQTIDEDLDKADIDRWLADGVIREAKQAQAEQKAREEAAQLAQQAEEAAQRARDEADRAAVARATGVAPGGDDGRAAAASTTSKKK